MKKKPNLREAEKNVFFIGPTQRGEGKGRGNKKKITFLKQILEFKKKVQMGTKLGGEALINLFFAASLRFKTIQKIRVADLGVEERSFTS